MPKLLPVVWSKGVFLSPQHLQAQDRYMEDLLRFQLAAVQYKGWGFTQLQIDGLALSEGALSVLTASGVFPDNLSFDIPDADEAPLAKPIEECFAEGRQRCMFYLAVPERRQAGINVSTSRDGVSARFFSEQRMIRDENSSALMERPVALARKNLQILAEGENSAGSVLLPLIAIEKTEGGLYRPDPKYVPPVLDIHASAVLMGIAKALVELLVARSSQLAGARRQRNDSLADFSAADVANFWLLYTMNTEVPGFRHMLDAERVHPETLFRAMLRLAGSLMTFSSKYDLRDLPRYDHESPGQVFGLLDALLRELLETVVPSNFVALPLKLLRPSIYATAIDKDQYFQNSRFYLAVAADMKEPDLIQRIPQLAKVSSATHIENYIRQALPGIRMRHVQTPPRAIPVKLHYQYFSLEQTGEVWEALVRARNFAVYVSDEVVNPQMELIILLSAPA
ncbi:MAG: type VI secretion system baseplate subunit TssK [Janthinobacterium lividum]